MGHSSWKWPNSLHLKHLLLSLFIGLPETLECLILGLLSNLPKGLLDLNDPMLPNLPHLSFLLKLPKHPFHPLWPLLKFPLNFLLCWVKNGLKGFFTSLPSRSIGYKASVRWLTFSSREGSSVCLRGVLTGVLKRVNGAVAPGVVVAGVAAVGCGFLA